MLIHIRNIQMGMNKCCYHLLTALIWSFILLNNFCNTQAANLVESGNKLQLAREIDKQYVVPLDLRGKTGAQALEKMLVEDFRCNLEPISRIGLNEPPRSICIKKPSGFGKLCEKLYVTLRFEPHIENMSREEMLHKMQTLKALSASTLCPYEPEISAEFLAAQPIAEKELANQVIQWGLIGNTKSVYEKLLIQGFYCGFKVVDEKDSLNASKLVCTQKPTGIKNCYESKLTISIDWGRKVVAKNDLFPQMENATIITVHPSCELPAVKSKTPVL